MIVLERLECEVLQ